MAGVDVPRAQVASDEFVAFFASGVGVAGEFRCGDCGYGIVCRGALPTCPMCHCSTWEAAPWRPITRAREPQ